MAIPFQQTNRAKIVSVAYVGLVWFMLALTGSLLGTFVIARGRLPLVFGLTVGGPVILFVLSYLFSQTFRRFVQTLVGDPWAITALQAYRVIGVFFIVLASRNALPAVFALPAGYGDIFIGITAPLTALAWSSGTRFGKVIFVLWNVLGILDLLTAVSLGTLSPYFQAGPVTTASLLVFPLSLIPTFAVPISFILHVAGLGQFGYLLQINRMEAVGAKSGASSNGA
jgi:hypothetical protein